MHATTFLRSAAQLELRVEELYLGLARAFGNAPRAHDTFMRLAFEERQHALRFQLLERLKIPLPWPQDRLEEMRAAVDLLTGEIVALQATLSRTDGPGDPFAVLRRVAEMEERFSFLHAEVLAPEADPRLREVFASMARQDAEHARLLQSVSSGPPLPGQRTTIG